MNLRVLALGMLIGLAAVSGMVRPTLAAEPTVSSIGNKVICQCGCTLLLYNCNHTECTSRDQMTAAIKTQIAAGKSEGDIIQAFVEQYGPQVLAMPTKRGFNLSAWVMPFFALAVGGGAIYAALRTWVGKGRTLPRQIHPEMEQERGKYARRLDKELKEFESW
jgi:cytochrome c-type biogenesis protein CcmH